MGSIGTQRYVIPLKPFKRLGIKRAQKRQKPTITSDLLGRFEKQLLSSSAEIQRIFVPSIHRCLHNKAPKNIVCEIRRFGKGQFRLKAVLLLTWWKFVKTSVKTMNKMIDVTANLAKSRLQVRARRNFR